MRNGFVRRGVLATITLVALMIGGAIFFTKSKEVPEAQAAGVNVTITNQTGVWNTTTENWLGSSCWITVELVWSDTTNHDHTTTAQVSTDTNSEYDHVFSCPNLDTSKWMSVNSYPTSNAIERVSGGYILVNPGATAITVPSMVVRTP